MYSFVSQKRNECKYHCQLQHSAKKAYPKPTHGPQTKKNPRHMKRTGQLLSFVLCPLQILGLTSAHKPPSAWLLMGHHEHSCLDTWQQGLLRGATPLVLVNIGLWLTTSETCSASVFILHKITFPSCKVLHGYCKCKCNWIQHYDSICYTSSADLGGNRLTACPVVSSLCLILRWDTEIFVLLQVYSLEIQNKIK